MIDAAIVGLGRWGRTLVASVQGKSDRLRFTRAWFAARNRIVSLPLPTLWR